MSSDINARARIVIVGAGFGGLFAAKKLNDIDANITIIDRNNYHLFIPLLYQVATAGLSPSDISVPIRHILRKSQNTAVLMGEVMGLDLHKQEVLLQERQIGFDYLVLALGAKYNYFGHNQWETLAPSLRSLPNATGLRARILRAFEKAEIETDSNVRDALMTFCVIGGGPTGVEMAGAIAELSRKALKNEFRAIDPTKAKIFLLEAGPKILSSFSDSLSKKALLSLNTLGVDVRTNTRVSDILEDKVILSNESIYAHTILWAAGIRAPNIASWLKTEPDPTGRIKVNPDLSVPDHPNIFVIGDSAHVLGPDGKPLPSVAPVAMQQGGYVARRLKELLLDKSKTATKSFVYFDKGQLATVGRSFAVVQIGRFQLAGFTAWIIWAFVHIFYLIGFRNRALVFFQWAFAYYTYQRGARLVLSHKENDK